MLTSFTWTEGGSRMVALHDIPYLTTAQMVEVDRTMIEDYGIALVQMMENAGRHLAQLASRLFLDGNVLGKRVMVLAGSGGNGGGAMVCARHLHNWGADVMVLLTKAVEDLKGVPKQQGEILQRMGVSIGQQATNTESVEAMRLIVDGLIGYSLRGTPRGTAAAMIRWANDQASPILALDVPSGLMASTGEVLEPAIRATATMTLALPKEGLRIAGREIVGELYLADIGVPPELYAQSSLNLLPGYLFAEAQILRLW